PGNLPCDSRGSPLMRLAAPEKKRTARSEQIILFRVSGQLFAISSSSVQEVRSVDTLAGAAAEIAAPVLKKVKHIVRRGDKSLYVVNGALHFGLPVSPSALVFILRRTRTAVLLDGIEQMSTMTMLQALPQAFCHEERQWYRGLTAMDRNVVPVVKPEGFLSAEELALLDASMPSGDAAGGASTATEEGTEAEQ
ncbi:MAG: chemotaxis protein CheW, partial [Steroidobacteraceae bacterium]